MILLAFLVSFLLHLLLFGTAPMVDKIMNEMNLSHAEFGLIFSAVMVSLVVLRIPWGIIGDRNGYLQVLKISLPIVALSAILRAFSTSYWTLLITQLALGVGLASILPCLPLLVREWFQDRSGFATGIYISGFALGNGTALGLTPYLLEFLVWRKVLFIYGTVAAITALLWWGLASSNVKGQSRIDWGDLSQVLKDKYVWVLMFFMIACMGGYDTLATWMPKVLELKALAKSPALLLSLGFLVSGPISGTISDKIRSENNLIAFLGFAAALSIFGIVYTSGFLLLTCIFLAGFFLMSVLTLTLKAPAKHPRLSYSAGKVSGIISSLGNIGPMAMPVAFGFLIDFTGTYQFSVFMVGLVTIFTFVIGSRLGE